MTVICAPLDAAHNAELLALNRACPLRSLFDFRFDREPDFFAWPRRVFDAFDYHGAWVDGQLVAYGLAGYRSGWMGSDVGRWAYAGDLRVHPRYRGRGVMRTLSGHLIDRVPRDVERGLMIVHRGNAAAARVVEQLTGHGLVATPGGVVEVANIPIGFRRRCADVRAAVAGDRTAIVDLLNASSSKRLFASRCVEGEVDSAIAARTMLITPERGEVRGVIAWEEPASERRATILRYPATYAPVRAAWSIAARMGRGVAPLPSPGEVLRGAVVTQLAAAGDDPKLIRMLVAAAAHALEGSGTHVLQVGAIAGDPVLEAMRGLVRFPFRSDVWFLHRRGSEPATSHRPPLLDLRIL